MSKQMLELLGRCLESNGIEFVMWNLEPSFEIPIEIDDEAFDYLSVTWKNDEFKVSHEELGTLYKSTSTVDTCEFIKNEIENMVLE